MIIALKAQKVASGAELAAGDRLDLAQTDPQILQRLINDGLAIDLAQAEVTPARIALIKIQAAQNPYQLPTFTLD